MTAPFEIIAGPITAYQAAVGEAFPVVEVTPAGNWAQIGTSGDQNITEDGVTIAHPDEQEMFYSLGGTGPRKVFRVREGLIVRFILADLSLEQYRHVLNSNAVADTAAGGGFAGFRSLDMYRGSSVAQFALLLRGTFSAYGASWNSQFQIPVCSMAASPEPVFVKGVPAALAFEFVTLEDPNAATSADRFGKIVVQDAAVV